MYDPEVNNWTEYLWSTGHCSGSYILNAAISSSESVIVNVK